MGCLVESGVFPAARAEDEEEERFGSAILPPLLVLTAVFGADGCSMSHALEHRITCPSRTVRPDIRLDRSKCRRYRLSYRV